MIPIMTTEINRQLRDKDRRIEQLLRELSRKEVPDEVRKIIIDCSQNVAGAPFPYTDFADEWLLLRSWLDSLEVEDDS